MIDPPEGSSKTATSQMIFCTSEITEEEGEQETDVFAAVAKPQRQDRVFTKGFISYDRFRALKVNDQAADRPRDVAKLDVVTVIVLSMVRYDFVRISWHWRPINNARITYVQKESATGF